MVNLKTKAILFALIFLIVVIFAYLKESNGNVQTAMVVRVIDGDTIELSNGNIVRLIGINAPEKGSYYFEEAKTALKNLVENKTVKLEKDVNNNDKYGRLLRYIFLGDKLINLELVKNGYAHVFIVKPDTKYKKELINAENEAKLKQLGLWKLSKYAGCIKLRNFNYIERNANPNDEYVTLKNVCNYTIDFSNWTISDNAENSYKLKLTLKPNSTITINSGFGKSNNTHFFLNRKIPIWNNDGDTLYLRDSFGYLVLNYTFGK
jgi:micrococcal nuclease